MNRDEIRTLLLDENFCREFLPANFLVNETRDDVKELLRLVKIAQGPVAACGNKVICSMTPAKQGE